MTTADDHAAPAAPSAPAAAPAARVLVVEDTPQIAELMSSALRFEGYDVDVVGDGAVALERIAAWQPQLVLLDVMLPGLDGFAVQRALAGLEHVPAVIVVSARDDTVDLVRGLDLGAEDYVTKPFRIEELLARVRTVLRRVALAPAAGGSAQSVPATVQLRFHDLLLDDGTHEVTRGARHIELTPREFDLLRYLLENANLALSRSQILDAVWEYDFGGDSGIVETYISYLRRKVDVEAPALIHTVRGVGYSLRLPRGD
ncbi:MAG: response regulator transcription factor [Thermoleophilia bacterium]|nr:response regulator transcription factor [Thermoleophilia bacterium]